MVPLCTAEKRWAAKQGEATFRTPNTPQGGGGHKALGDDTQPLCRTYNPKQIPPHHSDMSLHNCPTVVSVVLTGWPSRRRTLKSLPPLPHCLPPKT